MAKRKEPVDSSATYDNFTDNLPRSLASVIEHKKKAMTAADLAELFPIKANTFLQWTREGRFPGMKLNGCVVYDPKTTAAWLRQRTTQVK